MVRLYLMQHADADSKSEGAERTITPQGKADTEKMAKYTLTHLKIKPGEIIHSGKKRAEQTAAIIGKALGLSKKISIDKNLAPMSDISIWAEKIASGSSDLMLIGHLPHLARFCAYLLCGDAEKPIVEFRNSGIVCLERGIDGRWSLIWIMAPDII